jgi:hypothetical protein
MIIWRQVGRTVMARTLIRPTWMAHGQASMSQDNGGGGFVDEK